MTESSHDGSVFWLAGSVCKRFSLAMNALIIVYLQGWGRRGCKGGDGDVNRTVRCLGRISLEASSPAQWHANWANSDHVVFGFIFFFFFFFSVITYCGFCHCRSSGKRQYTKFYVTEAWVARYRGLLFSQQRILIRSLRWISPIFWSLKEPNGDLSSCLGAKYCGYINCSILLKPSSWHHTTVDEFQQDAEFYPWQIRVAITSQQNWLASATYSISLKCHVLLAVFFALASSWTSSSTSVPNTYLNYSHLNYPTQG